MRDIITRFLSGSYTVTAADNGKAALKIIQESNHKWIVLTDNQMPEMIGIEFLRRAGEMTDKLCGAVLMSGDADIGATSDELTKQFLRENIPFLLLPKPFPKKELLLLLSFVSNRPYEAK